MKLSKTTRAKIATLIALVGIGDAIFLTYQHFNYNPFICPAFGGCEEVTRSEYSVILGIPISLLGVLFYLTVLMLLILFLIKLEDKFFSLFSLLTIAGFLFSLYLLFLMFIVIKAVCFWCMLSAISSTLLFIIGGLPFVIEMIRTSARLNTSDGRSNALKEGTKED